VLNYELKMSYEDKIKILYELSKLQYKDIIQEDRTKIVKWIKDNTSSATENLNLRLLFQLYEMFRFNQQEWKRLGKEIIKTNWEYELIVSGLSPKEWVIETGKHLATYYKYRNRIRGNLNESI